MHLKRLSIIQEIHAWVAPLSKAFSVNMDHLYWVTNAKNIAHYDNGNKNGMYFITESGRRTDKIYTSFLRVSYRIFSSCAAKRFSVGFQKNVYAPIFCLQNNAHNFKRQLLI